MVPVPLHRGVVPGGREPCDVAAVADEVRGHGRTVTNDVSHARGRRADRCGDTGLEHDEVAVGASRGRSVAANLLVRRTRTKQSVRADLSLEGPKMSDDRGSIARWLGEHVGAVGVGPRAAGAGNAFFGREVPGLVHALGLEGFGVDAITGIGVPGDSAYEIIRLAWPELRRGAAAVGIDESDLVCIDSALASATSLMVVETLFAAWGRRPR